MIITPDEGVPMFSANIDKTGKKGYKIVYKVSLLTTYR